MTSKALAEILKELDEQIRRCDIAENHDAAFQLAIFKDWLIEKYIF